MAKTVKTTVVSFAETQELDFKPSSKWYINDALMQTIYIHVRSREDAIKYVKEEYGGKYTVKCSGIQKSKGNLTCTGSETRKK
jgi:hypothetical protein